MANIPSKTSRDNRFFSLSEEKKQDGRKIITTALAEQIRSPKLEPYLFDHLPVTDKELWIEARKNPIILKGKNYELSPRQTQYIITLSGLVSRNIGEDGKYRSKLLEEELQRKNKENWDIELKEDAYLKDTKQIILEVDLIEFTKQIWGAESFSIERLIETYNTFIEIQSKYAPEKYILNDKGELGVFTGKQLINVEEISGYIATEEEYRKVFPRSTEIPKQLIKQKGNKKEFMPLVTKIKIKFSDLFIYRLSTSYCYLPVNLSRGWMNNELFVYLFTTLLTEHQKHFTHTKRVERAIVLKYWGKYVKGKEAKVRDEEKTKQALLNLLPDKIREGLEKEIRVAMERYLSFTLTGEEIYNSLPNYEKRDNAANKRILKQLENAIIVLRDEYRIVTEARLFRNTTKTGIGNIIKRVEFKFNIDYKENIERQIEEME